MKGEATLCTCRKECNKCDVTAALLSVSDWSIIMIDPGGFAISNSPPICYPSFLVSWVGLPEK